MVNYFFRMVVFWNATRKIQYDDLLMGNPDPGYFAIFSVAQMEKKLMHESAPPEERRLLFST